LTYETHGLETIHPRHEYIDDEQVELSGLEQSQARPAVVDGLDGMRITLEQDFDGGQDRSIIIDDENARHGLPYRFGALNPRLHIS
jgi:hypothetical protein